jgi:AraC-like DNA-binding protein
VVLDLLEELPQEPLTLPMPADPRARALAEGLARHPDDRRPLAELAREVGASPRTLQRAFLAEAGISFRAWRQQLRLHRALVLLAEGRSVTAAALEVGYESPSAFVAMFRRVLGTPPGRYFRLE